MAKFKLFYEICKNDGAILGWVSFITAIVLLVVGFFLPPMGKIDPSVLYAGAELLTIGTVCKLPNIIMSVKDGRSLSLKFKDSGLEIKSTEETDK